MMIGHTIESLRAFERDIAEEFNVGRIRAPIHLAGGNEEALIKIFRDVEPQDWVCTQWRSHYHCLLKGVPPAELKADIMAGRSITLNYPDHRVLSSAIVGGTLPIALGLAWSIKRLGEKATRVWAFVGDMTATTGIYNECRRYAACQGLPLVFVVEDNGKSVCTDTREAWGTKHVSVDQRRYRYVLPWPHSGAGKRVEF